METRLLVVLRESGIQTAGVANAASASTGSAGSSAGSLTLTNYLTAIVSSGISTAMNRVESSVALPPLHFRSLPRAAVVLTVEGKVEWLRLGTNVWGSVQTNHVLFPGDRLRTGLKSRATVRLPNQSVLRVHQLTTLEIQPPGGATNRALLNLQKGSIFFKRDAIITPVPFVTPAAKGRIEG